MKKTTIFILAFIIILTSCIPAFGIDTIVPIKTDPIITDPIIVQPISPILVVPFDPVWFNTRAVYTIPLYRLYSSSADKHTYTSSSGEKNDLIDNGWSDDGIVAYLSPVELPGYIPLYRKELLGQIERLSTSPETSGSWWIVTGTLGYIQSSSFTGSTLVHESVKELSEGEDFFDTDYYYCDDYYSLGYYGKIPKTPAGYNYNNVTFDMWDASTKIQEISLDDIASNVTGGHKYTLEWTSLQAGGKVDLLYSHDNGSTWDTIVEDLDNPSTSGSYSWTVPNSTKSEVKVKIYWKPAAGESSVAWDTSNTFSTTRDLGIIVFTPIDPGKGLLDIAPSAPTNLTANAGIISPVINLYWTDNSSIETGFSIERKAKGGVYATITTTASNATSYSDTSISSGVEYTYRVKATGTILNSGYSNEATDKYVGLIIEPTLPDGFIFPDFPDPPTNAAAAFTDSSMSEVEITWTPPSGDFTGFSIERNTGMAWSSIGTTGEDDFDFADTDLDGLSGEILYRVKTFDESLTSTPSNTASVNFDGEEETPDIFDGTQSEWAEPELVEAYEEGLTYPGVMYDYGREITREEFCVIAVKLYEKLSGETAVAGDNPFVDTDNPDILKAYALGIVKGISATEFAPSWNITRQEMCVMIYRALHAAEHDVSVNLMSPFPFTDEDDIADWAINEVKFCYQKGIMNGTSPTTIDPLMNTPREQAIILIFRTYDAFRP